MLYRDVLLGINARKFILLGMQKVAEAVASTLGPKGKTVVYYDKDRMTAHVTKDGVTVAKTVLLKDTRENMGALLLQEASIKTNEMVGDGTTTATVLAWDMIQKVNGAISGGNDGVGIREGMFTAMKEVKLMLLNMAIPVKENNLLAVATISANNDTEIGGVVSEAIQAVGAKGVIRIENGAEEISKMVRIRGMQIEKGMVNRNFITDHFSSVAEYENAYVALVPRPITAFADIKELLEHIHTQKRPLLLIADSFSEPVIGMLIANKMKTGLMVVPVKSPGIGNRKDIYYQDISILTGATVVEPTVIEKKDWVARLGTCSRMIVGIETTTIIGGGGLPEEIDARAQEIQLNINESTTDIDREIHQARLTGFTDGVAIIYVGGYTELDQKEKKDRFVDSVSACRAAVKKGIIAGGGWPLYYISTKMLNAYPSNTPQYIGWKIVEDSIKSPLKVILSNGGYSEVDMLSEAILKGDPVFGFDAREGKCDDLIRAGIVDPVLVTEIALERAVGVAAMFAVTNAMVYEDLDFMGSQNLPGVVDMNKMK